MTATRTLFQTGIDAVRRALGDAGTELQRVRADLETKRRRREFLLVAPLPRSDVMAAIVARVDRQAAEYPRLLGRYLADARVAETRHEKLGRLADHIRPLHLASTSGASNVPAASQLQESALCYLVGDVVKARLAAALADVDLAWPEEVGPPAAERTVELQRLEAEIAQLEAEEQTMLAALRAAIGSTDTTAATPPERFIGGVPTNRSGKAAL